MSFGAMATWQAALLLAVAAAIAAWLFLMKVRPPRVQVPSLLLWQRVLDSRVTMAEAEARTLEFLAAHVAPQRSPICGNSICQDRRFLARGMPALERYFHYRNLDVSTIKELARRWQPQVLNGFTKAGTHTALSDIRESVAELAHYRRFMGRLGGNSGN